MKNNFSEKITEFSRKITANFSVPGHKGGAGIFYASYQNIFSFDVTEFDETDDLSAPSGIIADAQASIAEIYGAKSAHMLVNGSTAGIQAMIMSMCQTGGKLIVDRHCHRSVVSALILCGITPIFVERKPLSNFSIYGGIAPADVEGILSEHPDADGAIITSPTYYGICSDIASIAEILHSKGKFLLVDEAHGAHFLFSDSLPASALKSGADMAAVSVHKTLPCPTQTALLLVNRSLSTKTAPEKYPRVQECINLVQTTSPSYILMTAMVEGIIHTHNNREDLEGIITYCKEFTRFISDSTDIKVLASSDTNTAARIDPLRLVLNFSHAGISARHAAEKLWNDHGIRYEMCDRANIVFVVTSSNTKKDLNVLKDALLEIMRKSPPVPKSHFKIMPVSEINMALAPREAFFFGSEAVDLESALGRICAETVSSCPPGTVIAVPGQMMDMQTIEYIKEYVNKDKIRVVSRSTDRR